MRICGCHYCAAAELYVTPVIPTDSSLQHKVTDVVAHEVLQPQTDRQTRVRGNSLYCTFTLGVNENGIAFLYKYHGELLFC